MTLLRALEIMSYDCDTVGGVITAWRDARPQQSDAAIIAEASAPGVEEDYEHDKIAAQLDNQESIIRAFMLLVVDEFNQHATEQAALLQQIADATSLPDLKSRVSANVTSLSQRTAQQLRDGIRNKLGS